MRTSTMPVDLRPRSSRRWSPSGRRSAGRGAVSHPDLVVEVVGEDEMLLVARAGYPLAGRREVEPAGLGDCPVLRREAGSGTRALVDGALHLSVIRRHDTQLTALAR